MIEVTFLGVGEAFDENLPNTSLLVRVHRETSSATLLLDCGFTVPPQFWRHMPEVDLLDGIWISHFHADHCFGLPALLVRFWEEGRRKDLTILGQKGIDVLTQRCFDLAYPGFSEKLTFPIRFVEVEPNAEAELFGLTLRSAENNHSQRDLALRVEAGGVSMFYSGDGRPTPESVALARGSQLIVHESFHLDREVPGHGTVVASIDMAMNADAATLALVHIYRGVRQDVLSRVGQLEETARPVKIIIPKPGHRVVL